MYHIEIVPKMQTDPAAEQLLGRAVNWPIAVGLQTNNITKNTLRTYNYMHYYKCFTFSLGLFIVLWIGKKFVHVRKFVTSYCIHSLTHELTIELLLQRTKQYKYLQTSGNFSACISPASSPPTLLEATPLSHLCPYWVAADQSNAFTSGVRCLHQGNGTCPVTSLFTIYTQQPYNIQ